MTETTQSQSRLANGLIALSQSPLLWGAGVTYGFYQLIPYLPIYRNLARQYFCGHPIAYATTVLFFIGMTTLVFKAFQLRRELTVLKHSPMDAPELTRSLDLMTRIERVEGALQPLAKRFSETYLFRRIQDACAYIRGRRSPSELEEHLKYLAELAASQLHGSYALVRTITWAVPILGFLGTVIGITMAIANVTPEQLDTSLTEVTGGLAVAFDTTALALTLSLVLVFSAFVVERAEQGVLDRVEAFGIQRIACLFPEQAVGDNPLLNAEVAASEQLLERTEAFIDLQMTAWRESLESLRQQWMQTLARQQTQMDETLAQGMTTTLSNHDSQLSEVRQVLLDAFQQASSQLQQNTAESAQLLVGSVQTMQTELQNCTHATERQMTALQQQSEILLRIVGQEEQLTRLQSQLSDNLQAVRVAETLDETLHQLNAAVHVLTTRARPKAA